MGLCSPSSIVFHICSIGQVALAIAIACIVAIQLTDITAESGTSISYSCLLGTDYGSSSLCTYTFFVVGLSLAVSCVVSLVQCCTCNLCGLGKIVDVLLAGFGLLWWGVASGVIASNTTDQLSGVDPATADSVSDWRDAVPICCYVETGLFGLMLVSGFFRMCGLCCGK